MSYKEETEFVYAGDRLDQFLLVNEWSVEDLHATDTAVLAGLVRDWTRVDQKLPIEWLVAKAVEELKGQFQPEPTTGDPTQPESDTANHVLVFNGIDGYGDTSFALRCLDTNEDSPCRQEFNEHGHPTGARRNRCWAEEWFTTNGLHETKFVGQFNTATRWPVNPIFNGDRLELNLQTTEETNDAVHELVA